MLGKLAAFASVTALVVACAPDKSMPTSALVIRTPLYASNAGGQGDFNLGTHMTGDEEVCPPTSCTGLTPAASKAQGEAIFRVSDDGSSVDFRLIASNIDNVVQSHIHCGRPGANGGIRMWLYPVIGPTGTALTGPTGPQNGVLASGRFDPRGVTCAVADVGSAMPLLDAMRAGLAYVNVHTNDGVAPTNTGPGDFPGGEIRGQLDHGR